MINVISRGLTECRHAALRLAIGLGATSFARRRLSESIRRLERAVGQPSWDLYVCYELLARSYERRGDFDRADIVTGGAARHPVLREFAVGIHVRAGLRYASRGDMARAAKHLSSAEAALASSPLPDTEQGFVELLRRRVSAANV
jgi:hypothetical protein